MAARLAALSIVAALALGACASPAVTDADATPLAPISTTASPSPSETLATAVPSPSVVTFPTYSGRNPDMDDAEASARALHPATGEVWYDELLLVDTPAWVEPEAEDFFAQCAWAEVGTRGESTIVRCDNGWDIRELFEVDAHGNAVWVTHPYPHSTPGDNNDSWHLASGVPLDSDTYYDSLALPPVFSVNGQEITRGDLFGTYAPQAGDTVIELGATGNHRLVYVEHATPGAALVTFTADPQGSRDVPGLAAGEWMLVSPYGVFQEVTKRPLESLKGVTWTDSSVGAAGGEYYGDLSGGGCGMDWGTSTLYRGDEVHWWRTVGSGPTGDILIPTPENPIALGAYEFHVYGANERGEAPLTYEEFLAAPALIATPRLEGDGWWVSAAYDQFSFYWC